MKSCGRADATFHALVDFNTAEGDKHEENDGWRE